MPTLRGIQIPAAALLIGDSRVDRTGGGFYIQVDPSTGQELAEVTLATAAEVDQAVGAANDAQADWQSLLPTKRRDLIMAFADLLDDHHEEMSVLRSVELGAPKKQGKGLNMAVEYMRYFAGWVDKLEGSTIPLGTSVIDYTVPEPYGTVAALTPWNGGVVSVAMKVVPALVAGNCVVLKPSEVATLAPLRFGELALEAGIPSGVLNVIPGGIPAGEALVAHPGIDKISFTGSTTTARQVLVGAASNLTPVILELGGKSANIVFADADIDAAVMTTVLTALAGMSGQGCVLPTRLLVEDSIYDQVEELTVAAAAALNVGRPFDPGVQAGPVISEASLDRILDLISSATQRGDGTLLTGGHRLEGDLSTGFFVRPTVFGNVDNASPVAQDEIFGPVISLIRFSDEANAIQVANDSIYGLGGLVFTREIARGHRVAAALEVGSVGINAFAPMPPSAPFGGVKHSGFGREGGLVGVKEFVQDKNVYVNLAT